MRVKMQGSTRMLGRVGGVAAAAAIAWSVGTGPVAAQAPDKLRIGYALSLSGPFAPGAVTTTAPNYKLWAHDVNKAGGIHLKKYDKKVPVELVEYDDRSNVEEMRKQAEKLMISDKVDFVLPPWGTGMNMAAAPIFNKHGYPHLAVTAVNSEMPALAKRWPASFWVIYMPDEAIAPLVELLKQEHKKGTINNKVGIVYVAHQLGAELAKTAEPLLKKEGFEVVYDKSYPVDVQDLSQQIKDLKRIGPDSFLAFAYPGDSLMLTEQAKVLGYSPKIMYVAVGAPLPVYKAKFGANVEGIFGMGAWDPNLPGARDYFKRHVEVIGKEPDRAASPMTYASLQLLQQAIERVGEVDRKKITDAIATQTFDTIVGPIKFENNRRLNQPTLGQWQDGEYVAVGPAQLKGMQSVKLPKPEWK
jgi:branched-chain amino acid transport system substrate-binding protein